MLIFTLNLSANISTAAGRIWKIDIFTCSEAAANFFHLRDSLSFSTGRRSVNIRLHKQCQVFYCPHPAAVQGKWQVFPKKYERSRFRAIRLFVSTLLRWSAIKLARLERKLRVMSKKHANWFNLHDESVWSNWLLSVCSSKRLATPRYAICSTSESSCCIPNTICSCSLRNYIRLVSPAAATRLTLNFDDDKGKVCIVVMQFRIAVLLPDSVNVNIFASKLAERNWNACRETKQLGIVTLK